MRRAFGTLIVGVAALIVAATAPAADTVSVHLQRKLTAGHNLHITFHARRLPRGGYYYAVIVLQPYKKYTRTSPPPCATSSNMQRTDYGYHRGTLHRRIPHPPNIETYAEVDGISRALSVRAHNTPPHRQRA